jgi:hypothetical protein
MDGDPFEQIWVDHVQEIHAPISDAGFARMSLPGETAIWPREIVLSLRDYHPHKIEIIGVTDEAALHKVTIYLDDRTDYPEDLTQLIPELIEAARNCPGGFGAELEEDGPPTPKRAISPGDLAVLLEGPSCHAFAPHHLN